MVRGRRASKTVLLWSSRNVWRTTELHLSCDWREVGSPLASFPREKTTWREGGMCFQSFSLLWSISYFVIAAFSCKRLVKALSCKLLHGWRRGGPQQLLVPARLKEIYILKKKETSEQPGLSPKDASTCRQEEVELTLPHKPWHWIMFPRSSRSFSSDFKLLYGVISVFYVQSQVLRPPFFFTTSYRITRRLEPGVTWYLFSCLRVQTEKKKGISLNCKFRIVPSVSRIETAISRSHPQPSRGRVFFFFLLMRSTHAHADTHTPLRGFP